MKILFLCVANSARSQIAEGLAKSILGDTFEIQSAGSNPSGKVQPFAISTLKEIGIDISENYSKSIDDLSIEFMSDLDFVITLCAEEVCPVLPSKTAQKLHWPVDDPVGQSSSSEEQMQRFRTSRDLIEKHLLTLKKSLFPLI
tara:strand:- start:2954 stop:3382 length:429 start_codon:yes stop_codon:yes gene_type:complete